MSNLAIIGGGIGGLSTAIALQRKGISVKVYEGAPKFKPLGAGLALAGNAVKAYREIGVEEDVVRRGKKIEKMFIKDQVGNTISFTNATALTERFGVVNNFTIHRADLHEVLASLLKPGTIEFGKMASAANQDQEGVTINFEDGSQARADGLIAADGIHSPIRKALLPNSLPRYSGYTCWRAVVSNLPPGFNLDETSESWGPGRRFGVVPLTDGRVYFFATLNATANDQRMKSFTSKDLQGVFKNFHFPIPDILARTTDDKLIWGDIIDIKPIPQFSFGRIVLIGDAAHATTPNMGQGACMAIEDAATLSCGLSKYDIPTAFVKFERHRLTRTRNIVSQSWNLGKLAQWENGMLIGLRNALLKRLPQKTIDKQLESLYNVSFQL